MMHEVFATREAAVTKRGEIEGALKRAAQHLLPDAMMISPKGKRGRGGGSNSSSASRDPMPRSKASSVTLFLNRLLGLQLSDQALLLHLFNYLLRSAVRTLSSTSPRSAPRPLLPCVACQTSGRCWPSGW